MCYRSEQLELVRLLVKLILLSRRRFTVTSACCSTCTCPVPPRTCAASVSKHGTGVLSTSHGVEHRIKTTQASIHTAQQHYGRSTLCLGLRLVLHVRYIEVEFCETKVGYWKQQRLSEFLNRSPENHLKLEFVEKFVMASGQVLTHPKYSPIEEVSLRHLTDLKSPLSSVNFPSCHSTPLSMTRPEVQRLGSSTSSSKSVKSLEVCVFMKDGSVHELFLENVWTENAGELLLKVEDCLAIPPEAKDMFALWITSPLLQLQLKPHHIPFKLCRQWQDLLDKFTTASDEQKAVDEPIVCFQRNAFLDTQKEMEMYSNTKILVWLFSEAKSNILTGNYPCEGEDYEHLGGILAWLSHGKYDPEKHPSGYLKEKLHEYVPLSMCKEGNRWSWLKGKSASAAATIVEQRLFQQWDQVSEKVKTKAEAMQLFLKFCCKLPFYGSVFFSGQIEKVSSGISLRDCPDRPVRVAINRDGVFIMDSNKQELLLGLLYDEISWEYTEPAKGKPDCLPCLWLEFDVAEGSKKYSKLLQIFSKQAIMMNAMIEACVEELNKKDRINTPPPVSERKSVVDELLKVAIRTSAPVLTGLPVKEPKTSLCTKTKRLCLSTYSDNGELIDSKCKVKRPFTFPNIFKL